MAKSNTNGNCYICGLEAGKTVMKNHILKAHNSGDEPCYVLVIEGAYDPDYWLVVDIALDKSLSALDTFLRKIWLECCGHMSEFECTYSKEQADDPMRKICKLMGLRTPAQQKSAGKAKKLAAFDVGDKLLHTYDFGSSTELKISITAKSLRPKQKNAVRLLARNIAPRIKCSECDAQAEFICGMCGGLYEGEVYCESCTDRHAKENGCEREMMLPVTNSPRCGECGYTGEQDNFDFRKEN
ncbi:MAG: hypothetical protein FWD58_03740 [Firmicutes bacterium]|nr:hypothetical protein [Bacillota bacterium]